MAFIQLARWERRLLFEALITLVICRLRLRVQNVEGLQAWASQPGDGTIAADRVAWAVEAASRRMPRATCLCRALTLQRLLTKYRHSSEIRIGVEKNDGRFGAHAWLIHDGRVLIGALPYGKHELLVAWTVPNRRP
jgi:hypothetical protein